MGANRGRGEVMTAYQRGYQHGVQWRLDRQASGHSPGWDRFAELRARHDATTNYRHAPYLRAYQTGFARGIRS